MWSALLALSSGGCGRSAKPAQTVKPPAPAPKELSEAELRSYRANEAGAVMVLMYHRIENRRGDTAMIRTPDQFRKDLETLYAKGYRPVTLAEFAENRMNVPAGKTPVVITFDDSYLSQFRYTDPDGQMIDPDCAVGIIEEMNRKHPDWATKATFFILPQSKRNPPPFYQPDLVSDKLQHLVSKGYEIASHSTTHGRFRSMDAGKVRWELANSVRAVQEHVPDARVTSFAVPYGNAQVPRDASARKAMVEGSEGGTAYRMTAVVMAGWRPVQSPNTVRGKSISPLGQIAPFDPERIERILPDSRQAGKPGTFEYYLRYFDDNPRQRYVSDGDEHVVAVPKSMARYADEKAIRASGKVLRVYTPGPAEGAGGAVR